MSFSKSNTRRFRKNNPQLFDQIKASFEMIIRIDPKGEKNLIDKKEAYEVATGVLELKSLAESNYLVKDFFGGLFGTIENETEGQKKKTLLKYLNGIDSPTTCATR